MRAAISILIVRPGALGDTLLTLPALAYLKDQHPHSEIVFCASSWAGELQPMLSGLYNYIPFDSLSIAPLFSGSPAAKDLPPAFRRADKIIIYTSRPGSCFVDNVKSLCRSPVQVCDISQPDSWHMARRIAGALMSEVPDCPGDLPFAPFHIPESASEKVAARFKLCEGEDVIALHPGSGSSGKISDPKFFVRVINKAIRNRKKPVLIEGPADHQACDRVIERLPDPSVVSRARRLPLVQVAAILQRSSCFFGNDSGIAHLAAALGVRTRVFFKATDPAIWMPVGEDVKVFSV